MDVKTIFNMVNKRSAQDPKFKELALTDAKEAIREEAEVEIPANIEITFHEHKVVDGNFEEMVWIIPFYPKQNADGELTENGLVLQL